MNLAELCQRADTIFRGTVLDITEGTVHAGGADLPTVTYRLRVDEAFRGEFETVKGGRARRDHHARQRQGCRAFGPDAPPSRRGSGAPPPRTRPRLPLDRHPAQPGRALRSAPVGLGQGTFRIATGLEQEMAVNGADNAGLFRGMAGPTFAPGPIPYAELAARIHALVGPIQ
jgi:hypothetical protein